MRAVLVLVLLGCTEPTPALVPEPTPAPEPPMAPVEAVPAPVDPERARRIEALTSWLSGCAVGEASFAAHKLYTWTREDQIVALRAAPRGALLSRERSAGGDASLFDQAIAADAHPVPRFLRRPSQRARRFAWVTPWATRMGWEGGDYGDRLIEVTLRDDAWTARFDPRAPSRWRVVDAEGAEVSETEVARSPDRIAAVFHVGDGPRAFREVVLVNEAGIERWAYATDAIRARVVADAARLRELAAIWRDDAPEVPELDPWLRAGWSSGEASSLAERYRACLALGSDGYAPTADRVEAIAAALEAMPADTPISRQVPRARRVVPQATGISSWCDPTMGCPP